MPTYDKVKQFRADDETLLMLQELVSSDGIDESKMIRNLIRQEWKRRKGIVEVPVLGKLNEKTIIAVGKSGPMFDGGDNESR